MDFCPSELQPALLVFRSSYGNVAIQDEPALLTIIVKLQQSEWAIKHVALHLRNINQSFEAFNHDLINHHGIPGLTHEDSLAVDEDVCNLIALGILISFLKNTQPRALKLLYMGMNFGAVPFPEALFQFNVTDESAELLNLTNLGLISRCADTSFLQISSVVEQFLPSISEEEEAIAEGIDSAVEAIVSVFPSGEYETWPRCEEYLEHALSVLSKDMPAGTMPIKALIRLVRYLMLRSCISKAWTFSQKLIAMSREVLDSFDPLNCESLCLVSTLRCLMGKFEEAELLLLPIRERNHFDMLDSQCKSCLGIIWRRQARYSESIAILTDALRISQINLHRNHPDVFKGMYELARVLSVTGEKAKAESLLYEALTGQRSVLAAGHPQLLATKEEIAANLIGGAQHDEGNRLSKEVLAECEVYLGLKHFRTIYAELMWAEYLQQQGRLKEFDATVTSCHQELEQIFGPTHPDTLGALGRRAAAARLLARHDEAVTLQGIAYELEKTANGKNHPHTLDALNQLGVALCRAQRSGEAIDVHRRVLIGLRARQDADLPSSPTALIDCQSDLAQAMSEQGQNDEAEEALMDALNESRKVLGIANFRTLRLSSLLASHWYEKCHRSEGAATFIQKTIQLRKKHVGYHHPDNFANLWLLAKCQRRSRKFDEAINNFEQALASFNKTFGRQHPVVSSCQQGLEEAKKEQLRELAGPTQSNYHRPLRGNELMSLVQQFHATLDDDAPARTALVQNWSILSPPPQSICGSQLSTTCNQCRKVTLKNLLNAKSLVADDGGNIVDQIEADGTLGPLKLTFQDPLASSQTCKLCRLILHPFIKRIQERSTIDLYLHTDTSSNNSGSFQNVYVTDKLRTDLFVPRLLAYSMRDSFAAAYISRHAISDPIADQSLKRIRLWLQRCDESHEECTSCINGHITEAETILPKRVIQVSSGQPPRLFLSDGKHGRYIALSHCWGGKTDLRTTQANIDQHLRMIDCQRLSKTVQDAIYVTQKLGVEFLWVDSLCIIQDDKQDWLAEAPKMGSIYERAYLTLAATAATDGTQGLFASLKDDNIVRLRCDPENLDHGDMHLAPADIQSKEVKESPLNKRGWVLQERLLSRRTVYFAATQPYWECRVDYVGEHGGGKELGEYNIVYGSDLREALSKYEHPVINRSYRNLEGDRNQGGEESFLARSYPRSYDLHQVWRAIVVFYSNCGLTFQTDKLPALLGMATEILTRTKLEYQCGHWLEDNVDALASLLWTTHQKPLNEPAISRAPSWSWAALDGVIDFMMDGTDMSRLEKQTSDLQLLSSRILDPTCPEQVALRLCGLLKSANRCTAFHERPKTRSSSGPYPRSHYYHIGPNCQSEYQWFPNHNSGRSSTAANKLIRFYERFKPECGPLPPVDGIAWSDEDLKTEVLDLPPPGIGWVCFDNDDVRPEEFVLLNVFTRQFVSDGKQKTPQNLALALVKTGKSSLGTHYRRVGVAQVHQADWFVSARKELLMLI